MIDEQDYKLPALQEAEAQIKALHTEAQALLAAIANGEVMHHGEISLLKLSNLFDGVRLKASRHAEAQASQEAYKRFISTAEASLQKQAIAAYASVLVRRYRLMQKGIIRELERLESDSGSRELEFSRKVTRDAGVPSDIVERVYSDVTKKRQEIIQTVKDKHEADGLEQAS